MGTLGYDKTIQNGSQMRWPHKVRRNKHRTYFKLIKISLDQSFWEIHTTNFGRKFLGGLGVDVRTILRWIEEIGCQGVDWIHLAHDSVQQCTNVNVHNYKCLYVSIPVTFTLNKLHPTCVSWRCGLTLMTCCFLISTSYCVAVFQLLKPRCWDLSYHRFSQTWHKLTIHISV
jgi:hypothetical protein